MVTLAFFSWFNNHWFIFQGVNCLGPISEATACFLESPRPTLELQGPSNLGASSPSYTWSPETLHQHRRLYSRGWRCGTSSPVSQVPVHKSALLSSSLGVAVHLRVQVLGTEKRILYSLYQPFKVIFEWWVAITICCKPLMRTVACLELAGTLLSFYL